MAKIYKPPFAQNQLVSPVSISTANTVRDGSSGTIAQLYTTPADGARIAYIRAVAVGTTTAGMIRVFFSTTSGGTKFLIGEISVSAVTPSASVPVWNGELLFTEPLLMKQNYTLHVSTHNAETFHVFAVGAEYA